MKIGSRLWIIVLAAVASIVVAAAEVKLLA